MTDGKGMPQLSRAVRKAIERELMQSSLSEEQKHALYRGFLFHESPVRCAADARLDPRVVVLWYHRLALKTAIAGHADAMHRNGTEK